MKGLVALFILLWLAFAIFDISFERSVFRAYTAVERTDHKPDDSLPRLLPNPVHEYRIRGDSVVGKMGFIINEYDLCTVFDEENWTCTYSDDSGSFGANQGDYFERTNIEKFPHLVGLKQNETLSRFGYIWLKCRWDATDAVSAITCLFRPFVT